MNKLDIIGKKFNKLLVISEIVPKDKHSWFLCECDCGKYTEVRGTNLTNNKIKSCGCLRIEHCVKTRTTHHQTKTKLYSIWRSMIKRCYNKNRRDYSLYGGRGITVCNKWLGEQGFENFRDWAYNNGYKEEILPNGLNKWTIDRTNVNGNYEPSNCRFITNKEQMRNKRNNVKVIFNNKEELLFDLCEKFDMPYSLVYGRIHCYNWSVEDALKFPKGVSRWKKSTT